MRQAGSHELFSYWNEIRKGRAAPERADIDPAAIRDILADTFILEVDSDRGHPVCLTGTRLNALFDTEIKGRSFLSLWSDAQKPDIASLVNTVTDGVCPVVAGLQAGPADYEKSEFELLLLPLRHLGKTHSRVMGRIAPARHPSWLGLLPVQTLDFISMRVLVTDDLNRSSSLTSKRINIGSGDSIDFPSIEQRKHLRIVVGQDDTAQP